ACSRRSGSSSEGFSIRAAARLAASPSSVERARIASRTSSSVKRRAVYPPEATDSIKPSEASDSSADCSTRREAPNWRLSSASSIRVPGRNVPFKTISRKAGSIRRRPVPASSEAIMWSWALRQTGYPTWILYCGEATSSSTSGEVISPFLRVKLLHHVNPVAFVLEAVVIQKFAVEDQRLLELYRPGRCVVFGVVDRDFQAQGSVIGPANPFRHSGGA